jgi:hypothetical protein
MQPQRTRGFLAAGQGALSSFFSVKFWFVKGRIAMKNLKWNLLASGFILVSLCSQAWATTLPLGEVVTGTITEVAQVNKYTFSANKSDVIDFTLVVTSGSLIPKIQLFNSSGTSISSTWAGYPGGCGGSYLEMNTVMIPATGTYTVWVNDCNNTNTGDYSLYAQRTNNPTGAVNLPFGETETGTIGSVALSNSYTFSANANDVVDFTLVATSGSLVPKIRLYNPNGTQLNETWSGYPGGCGGSYLEMNTVTLPTTGTYTVLIGDCADSHTGKYSIYSQRTDAPAGPVALLFGQTQTGSITAVSESYTYTFSANANDLIDFTLVTTSGSMVPKIRLYDPNGTQNNAIWSGYPGGCGGSVAEMNTVTLPTTGTYTVLIGDCADSNTGNFSIYSQRTNKPSKAVNLPYAKVQTGLVGSVALSNTYTFSATANDVVDFTMLTTSGSLVPKIILYNPNGAENNSIWSGYPGGCGGTLLEMNTVTLPATGVYTLLVRDCSDTHTGNYAIDLQRTNNPTGSTPFPPVGGVPIFWGDVQTGSITSNVQSATYYFVGTASNVVDLTMVSTKGSLIPKIRLYNPDGSQLSAIWSGYPGGCGGTTAEMSSVTLSQTGAYTLLVGDCNDANTGNYSLSTECFGTCPTTPLITWATPAAITYPTALSGTQLDATASVNGDSVAGKFVYSPVSGTVLKAGTQTLSLTFTPTDTTDYTKAADSVQLTVNKGTPVITWATPAAITYPTALSATQLDASANVPGTSVYSPVSGTVLAPGTQTLSVTFTPTDTTDYKTATDSVDVTVNNPVPTLTSISPTSVTAGAAAFTLTVNGTNFDSNSVVEWNAVGLTTTYVSATQLTAAVPATDVTTVGTVPVTVFNPTPGGGTTTSKTFTVNGTTPAPSLSSLSATSALVGAAAFTLTVNGANFVNGSTVKWNGSSRTTTYVSTGQLKAAILATDLATAGTFPVTVVNPSPPVGPSNALDFTVNNPAPTLTSIAPDSITAGGSAFTLTLNGTGFVSGSVVKWNTTLLSTTYVSATKLTAPIPATDSTPGTVSVTVVNATPGGGTSNAETFTINNPVPILTTLSPNNATHGGSAFTMTVNGYNFVEGAVVKWNGTALTTTYLSGSQLQVTVPSTDIATAGSAAVTVANPAPSPAASNTLTFTIN